MSPANRCKCLFVLLAITFGVSAMTAAQDNFQPAPGIVTAKIKLDDLSMIIVPVSINGSGPYNFMLDTGCAKTMVDSKLADELALPRVGVNTVVGVLASTKMSIVRVNSVSIAGATVSGGQLLSFDHPATVTNKVRGVLGEDFLKNFDVLIDYGRQVIQLEYAAGSMAGTVAGEHLPLQLDGMYQGHPTGNRLAVSGKILEFENESMTLLLDSAANHVTVFRKTLGPEANQGEPLQVGSLGLWTTLTTATLPIRYLSLGRSTVHNLVVVGIARRPFDGIDGLIPTSLFHSIFISHREKFVVLNPSFPKPRH